MQHHNVPLHDKILSLANLIYRGDCTYLQNCRPDPPDDQQQIHRDRPVFGDPVLLRSGRLIPQALSWPGAVAQASYQKGRGTCRKCGCPISKYQQLTFHFSHIPDTQSPWQCDTLLRTPPSLTSVCPLNVRGRRYRFLDTFKWAKELPQFLFF